MAHDMGAVPTNEAEAFQNLQEVYMYMAEKSELPIRLFAFTPLTAWSAFTSDFGTEQNEICICRAH